MTLPDSPDRTAVVTVLPVDPAGPPPAYCCAILRAEDGRVVLERRPLHKRDAPGQLTCFGGRREAEETPGDCIARELREELGFVPVGLTPVPALALHVGGELIAWFYAADLDPSDPTPRPEPGVEVVHREMEALEYPEVSGWHLPVLRAWAGSVEGLAPSAPSPTGSGTV